MKLEPILEVLVNQFSVKINCIDEIGENIPENAKVKNFLHERNSECMLLEKHEVKRIIYKGIKLIFLNTTQQERYLFLDEMFEKFYDMIIQKLITAGKMSTIISKIDFNMIIRNYIPFIKLDLVLENNCDIEELLEYLDNRDVLREDVFQIVKKKYGKQTFDYIRFKLVPITAKIGFLGDYAKLEIFTKMRGDHLTNQKEETSYFFIKFIPKDHDGILKAMATNSFIKEDLFYTKFVPLVEETGEIINFIPKCYFVSNNFIVLEDLSVSNYSSVKLLTNLDCKHCSITIKQLAKMHSFSIILEEKFQIQIDKYFPEMIKETQIQQDEMNIIHIEHIIKLLKNFPDVNKLITTKEFQLKAKKSLYEIFDKVKKSDKYRNVVNHGDIWWNNIFYSRDQNGVPVDCILLDFQLLRYLPPAFDLLMFLHITTDRKMREDYMEIYIDEYYTELKSILKTHDIDIENILTYNDLLRSLDDLKILGIYLSTLYNYINTVPSDVFNEIFSNPDTGIKFWTNIDFRCEIFDQIWDKMKHNKMLKDNTIDLYEYCLKNI